MLYRPYLAGRLKKLEIELSEFEISFEARKALKEQLFVDFLAKMTAIPFEPDRTWVVFTDGSSKIRGSEARVILEKVMES